MRSFIFILTCICFSATIAVAQPYQIGHLSATFTDTARSSRSVPVEIYYPADITGDNVPFAAALSGKVPAISFGHGFVMTYDAYANIKDAVVAEGYIIAFPTTEGSLSPSHSEFGKDLAFVLKKVAELGSTSGSVLFNKVDTGNCVMGHSMGGGAAHLAMTFDPSIKAIATLAAAETTPSATTAAASVTAPALVFAGENDCVSPPATNQLLMYTALSAACKHYIKIKGGSHCQMAGTSITCSFGESTCTPAPTITRAAQHATINKYLIPWLNYTLKGNCTDGSTFETALSTDAAVTYSKNCTLCGTASLQHAGSNNTVAIYPNPCTDKIIFALPEDVTATVHIYSATGSAVHQTTGRSNTTISTQKYAPGIYFYQITAPHSLQSVRGYFIVNGHDQ